MGGEGIDAVRKFRVVTSVSFSEHWEDDCYDEIPMMMFVCSVSNTQ